MKKSISSSFYSTQDRFYVAVDCIIFGFRENELNLLVHRRKMDPGAGGLSLMGGFVRKDESINRAAKRVLSNLTGLDKVYMEQVGAYGEVDRDPGERVTSVAYYALIDINKQDKDLLAQHSAFWVSIEEAKKLIFDHSKMVNDALRILRRKARNQPIGEELLPEKFTLTQLQTLYEAIYGIVFDKRNFRKKILNLGFVKKLNEIDKVSSKKGAYFYTFSREMPEGI